MEHEQEDKAGGGLGIETGHLPQCSQVSHNTPDAAEPCHLSLTP